MKCWVTTCWDATLDAPYLQCIIKLAHSRSPTPLLLFIEDHVLIFEDFLPALLKVAAEMNNFFIIGGSSALTLTVDQSLDLPTWQHDIKSAFLFDSSAERLKELEHQLHAAVDHSHSLHYFAYRKDFFDANSVNPLIVMGGGQYYGHRWEKLLVAHILLADTLAVVDISGAVTAVELIHSDTTNRTADLNAHNSALIANTTIALGRLENAHYILHGRCPTCALKENREADLPLILQRRANDMKQIIVIAVNSDYLALVFNWICRAHSLFIYNYVMLAEDRVSYRILRKMHVPVVLRTDAPYKKVAALPGTEAFQETLYLRALFFKEVVHMGFSMVLAHLDTLWFEDPLTLFASPDCDMYVQMEAGDKAGGGVLSIKANKLGSQFVSDYLNCEKENWLFIMLHHKPRFSYSDDPDIDCIELISTRLSRRNSLHRCVLDPLRYVSENNFFDEQRPQQKAIYPAYVHLNNASGVVAKTKQFLDWDLWAVDDLAMSNIPLVSQPTSHGEIKCKQPPTPLPPPHFDDREDIQIIVNILAATEHGGLEETLSHLAAAAYDGFIGRGGVDIRIVIQQPEHDTLMTSKNYVLTTQVATDFKSKWKWGEFEVVYLEEYVGATAKWLDHWDLGDDSERADTFQLALLAGQLLSQEWMKWTRRALENYYFDPFQYDPFVMGIHLAHTMDIFGESPGHRIGSRLPSSIVNATLYSYQYVPLIGTLFFPRHLTNFLYWFDAQNQTARDAPCVPTLFSNSEWLRDPVHHWWQWLIRFTFESGWYALHTNFHSIPRDTSKTSKPRALLVDDAPTAGKLDVNLIKKLATRELTFTSKQDIKLYDLHMNEFKLPPMMLQRRKFLFPPMAAVDRRREASSETFNADSSGLFDRLRHMNESNPWSKYHTSESFADSAPLSSTLDVDILDDGVTVTDVIVQSMMAEMARGDSAADGSSESKSDAAAASARLKDKIALVESNQRHRHVKVRGATKDRCFTIADSKGELDPAMPQPNKTQLNMTMTIDELYLDVYNAIITLLPAKPDAPGKPPLDSAVRFIIYQPAGKPVAFDRHLRGISYSFLVAALSKRILVIDLPEFDAQFDCPFSGVKWSYAHFKPFLVNTPTAFLSDKSALRTDTLEALFPANVLIHKDPVSFDRTLFKNAKYAPYATALFNSFSRMRRTGKITSLLLSKPKNALIQASRDLQRELGMTAVKYSVCVHVVVPAHTFNKNATAEVPMPGVDEEQWNCIKAHLTYLGFVREDTAVLFSSNKPSHFAFALADSHLGKFGKVVVNRATFNASTTNMGMCNATVRASTSVDALTGQLIYDPAIVNGYVFGECDVSVSSGTTYGIFNAARTGFTKRAYTFVAAPPPVKVNGVWQTSSKKDYCGPMHRIDMHRDNDIEY